MKICQCCGLRMNLVSAQNPNICVDCESLTLDDGPAELAAQTPAPPPATVAVPDGGIPERSDPQFVTSPAGSGDF